MKIICGTDEAGRGPVLGPLVIAGVSFKEENLDALKALGVKDSKLLTEKQRENLFDKILDLAHDSHIINISAEEIDSRSSIGLNLNQLEALKISEIITALKPNTIYVDSPVSPDGAKFTLMIQGFIENPVNTEIISEHKADTKHPEVAAASIIAKVTRDRAMKEIEKEIGTTIGSGYPADPETKKFLGSCEENEQYKIFCKYIRRTWATFKNMKAKKAQTDLSKF